MMTPAASGSVVEFTASGLGHPPVGAVLRRCRRISLRFDRAEEGTGCVVRVKGEFGCERIEELCQSLAQDGTPFSRWDRKPGDAAGDVRARTLHLRSGWEGPRLGHEGSPCELMHDPAAFAYVSAELGRFARLCTAPAREE